MKKTLLLFITAVFVGSTASAQTDNTLQFVDEKGYVVEDGATVNGKLEYIDLGDPMLSYYEVNAGLSVKNNASEPTGVGVEYKISRLDNGSFSCCFPGNCIPQDRPGSYESPNGEVDANVVKPFIAHWTPTAYGQCKVTFKLKVMTIEEEEKYGEIIKVYRFKAYGPEVTVNFVYDETSAGIDGVNVDKENKIVGYYTLDGCRLAEPQSGINIVKYANGKTAKIVVKH